MFEQAMSLPGTLLQTMLAAEIYHELDYGLVVLEVHGLVALRANEKGLPALRALRRVGEYQTEQLYLPFCD